MTHILLVDDEDSIIKLTSFMLKAAGYQISTASNGEQALEIIKNNYQNIDLIISDHIMPKMNGLELTEKVAQYNIPIIMVTAMVDEFKRETPYCVHAKDFIVKPFTKQTLEDRVAKVLDKKNREKVQVGNKSFYKGSNILFHGKNYLEQANQFINILDRHTPLTIISNNQQLNTEHKVLFYEDSNNFIKELIKISEESGQTLSDKKGGFRVLVNFPLAQTDLVAAINNSCLSLGDLINVYFNEAAPNLNLFDEVYLC